MQQRQINLDEIEPMWGYDYYNPDLVERVREKGWEGIPPIPVIEIPQRLRVHGKRYHHSDGHKRHNAAIVTNADTINCIIYDGSDDLQEVCEQTGASVLLPYTFYLEDIERNLDRRSSNILKWGKKLTGKG